MDYTRDLIIKDFMSVGKRECSRINLQYFNCIEAKSLVADYIYQSVKDYQNLPEEIMKSIAEDCDRDSNFSECNEYKNK
jgi:hypothetical protein